MFPPKNQDFVKLHKLDTLKVFEQTTFNNSARSNSPSVRSGLNQKQNGSEKSKKLKKTKDVSANQSVGSLGQGNVQKQESIKCDAEQDYERKELFQPKTRDEKEQFAQNMRVQSLIDKMEKNIADNIAQSCKVGNKKTTLDPKQIRQRHASSSANPCKRRDNLLGVKKQDIYHQPKITQKKHFCPILHFEQSGMLVAGICKQSVQQKKTRSTTGATNSPGDNSQNQPANSNASASRRNGKQQASDVGSYPKGRQSQQQVQVLGKAIQNAVQQSQSTLQIKKILNTEFKKINGKNSSQSASKTIQNPHIQTKECNNNQVTEDETLEITPKVPQRSHSGEILHLRTDLNERYFREGETSILESVLVQRQRQYMMDKLFLSKLQNVCKKVKEMQEAYEQAQKLQKALREKRMKEAHKKYKAMLKKIQVKKQQVQIHPEGRKPPNKKQSSMGLVRNNFQRQQSSMLNKNIQGVRRGSVMQPKFSSKRFSNLQLGRFAHLFGAKETGNAGGALSQSPILKKNLSRRFMDNNNTTLAPNHLSPMIKPLQQPPIHTSPQSDSPTNLTIIPQLVLTSSLHKKATLEVEKGGAGKGEVRQGLGVTEQGGSGGVVAEKKSAVEGLKKSILDNKQVDIKKQFQMTILKSMQEAKAKIQERQMNKILIEKKPTLEENQNQFSGKRSDMTKGTGPGFLEMTKPNEIIGKLFNNPTISVSSINSKSSQSVSVSNSSTSSIRSKKSDKVEKNTMSLSPMITVKSLGERRKSKTGNSIINRNKLILKKQSNMVGIMKRDGQEISNIVPKLQTNNERQVFQMLGQRVNSLFMKNRRSSIRTSQGGSFKVSSSNSPRSLEKRRSSQLNLEKRTSIQLQSALAVMVEKTPIVDNQKNLRKFGPFMTLIGSALSAEEKSSCAGSQIGKTDDNKQDRKGTSPVKLKSKKNLIKGSSFKLAKSLKLNDDDYQEGVAGLDQKSKDKAQLTQILKVKRMISGPSKRPSVIQELVNKSDEEDSDSQNNDSIKASELSRRVRLQKIVEVEQKVKKTGMDSSSSQIASSDSKMKTGNFFTGFSQFMKQNMNNNEQSSELTSSSDSGSDSSSCSVSCESFKSKIQRYNSYNQKDNLKKTITTKEEKQAKKVKKKKQLDLNKVLGISEEVKQRILRDLQPDNKMEQYAQARLTQLESKYPNGLKLKSKKKRTKKCTKNETSKKNDKTIPQILDINLEPQTKETIFSPNSCKVQMDDLGHQRSKTMQGTQQASAKKKNIRIRIMRRLNNRTVTPSKMSPTTCSRIDGASIVSVRGLISPADSTKEQSIAPSTHANPAADLGQLKQRTRNFMPQNYTTNCIQQEGVNLNKSQQSSAQQTVHTIKQAEKPEGLSKKEFDTLNLELQGLLQHLPARQVRNLKLNQNHSSLKSSKQSVQAAGNTVQVKKIYRPIAASGCSTFQMKKNSHTPLITPKLNHRNCNLDEDQVQSCYDLSQQKYLNGSVQVNNEVVGHSSSTQIQSDEQRPTSTVDDTEFRIQNSLLLPGANLHPLDELHSTSLYQPSLASKTRSRATALSAFSALDQNDLSLAGVTVGPLGSFGLTSPNCLDHRSQFQMMVPPLNYDTNQLGDNSIKTSSLDKDNLLFGELCPQSDVNSLKRLILKRRAGRASQYKMIKRQVDNDFQSIVKKKHFNSRKQSAMPTQSTPYPDQENLQALPQYYGKHIQSQPNSNSHYYENTTDRSYLKLNQVINGHFGSFQNISTQFSTLQNKIQLQNPQAQYVNIQHQRNNMPPPSYSYRRQSAEWVLGGSGEEQGVREA